MTDRSIKLVALDLDGTFLTRHGQIVPENVEAVREVARRGVHVCLASGRMTPCMQDAVDSLGIPLDVIAYNGAMALVHNGQGLDRLHHKPVPRRYNHELIEFALEHHLCLNLYVDDVLIGPDWPEVRHFAELYTQRTGAPYRYVPDLREYLDTESTKALFVTDPDRREQLHAHFTSRFDASELNILRSNPEYLEIMSPEADKALAIEALCRRYDITLENVMALGDQDNDASMLAAVGLGVAMAEGSEGCKAAADVVEPSVAVALERIR